MNDSTLFEVNTIIRALQLQSYNLAGLADLLPDHKAEIDEIRVAIIDAAQKARALARNAHEKESA